MPHSICNFQAEISAPIDPTRPTALARHRTLPMIPPLCRQPPPTPTPVHFPNTPAMLLCYIQIVLCHGIIFRNYYFVFQKENTTTTNQIWFVSFSAIIQIFNFKLCDGHINFSLCHEIYFLSYEFVTFLLTQMQVPRFRDDRNIHAQADNLYFACDFSFSDFLDVNSYDPSLAFQPHAPDIPSDMTGNDETVHIPNPFTFTFL